MDLLEFNLKIDKFRKKRAVRIIENFYIIYVKCKRINEDGKMKPIDPIYHIPFEEKYRIRLVNKYSCKKTGKDILSVFHFNIITLIEWINTAKKYTNPITNLYFTKNQIEKIKMYSNKFDIQIKLLNKKSDIKSVCNCEVCINKKNINKIKKQYETELKLFELLEKNKNEEFVDLLLKNQDKISNNIINLNYISKNTYDLTNELKDIISTEYNLFNNNKITDYTLLHLAIIKRDLNIIDLLLTIGFDIYIKTECMSLLHLTVIFNLPFITKQLIFLGLDINLKSLVCKNNSTYKNIDIFELLKIINNENFISQIFS